MDLFIVTTCNYYNRIKTKLTTLIIRRHLKANNIDTPVTKYSTQIAVKKSTNKYTQEIANKKKHHKRHVVSVNQTGRHLIYYQ